MAPCKGLLIFGNSPSGKNPPLIIWRLMVQRGFGSSCCCCLSRLAVQVRQEESKNRFQEFCMMTFWLQAYSFAGLSISRIRFSSNAGTCMATCQNDWLVKRLGAHTRCIPRYVGETTREREICIYIYIYISESIFCDKPPKRFRENLERHTGYVTCGRLKGYGQTVQGAERNNTGFWPTLVPDALYGYGMRSSNGPQRDIVFFSLCASRK